MTSILNQPKSLVAGLVLGSLIALPVYADSHGSNNYINLGIGLEDYDGDRNLKDDRAVSLGYEHRYNNNWAAEISLLDSSPRPEGGGSDVDLLQLGIDALYYFDQADLDSNFQPYGAFGLGFSEFDNGTDTDTEAQARVGFGLRYLLSEHWSAKGDFKLLYSEETHSLDNVMLAGLSYAFSPQKGSTMVAAMDAKDSDGDGVNDDEDQCAATAAGVSVDSKGCMLDGDSDGVADNLDDCLETDAGASVDAKGCMLDGDKDGVGDYRDECLSTEMGREVDTKGCKLSMTHMEEMTLQVNFASNANEVPQNEYSEIEAVANFMKKYSDVNADIQGHTDDRGAAAYNQSLSQSRANAVRHVLIETYGIAASRVSATGHGETRPIKSNDTKAGRMANRRVVAVMKAEVSE